MLLFYFLLVIAQFLFALNANAKLYNKKITFVYNISITDPISELQPAVR